MLSIASGWKMEGAPWFDSLLLNIEMGKRYGNEMLPGTLSRKVYSLERYGALESQLRQMADTKGPWSEIPDLAGAKIYSQITQEGLRMRQTQAIKERRRFGFLRKAPQPRTT